jgi:hypothetical protein
MTNASVRPPDGPQIPVHERIRARSGDVMFAVFRLVKTAMLHSVENAAVREAAGLGASSLQAFAADIGTGATLSFLTDTFFVSGQLLRAPRAGYEAAAELALLLARVKVSEITFEVGLQPAALSAFGAALVRAIREAENGPVTFESQVPGIEARHIDTTLLERRSGENLDPAAQILRLYANALVLLRQFYQDLATGKTALPTRLKRLAQRFVVLSEKDDPAMLGMTSMAKAHRDDAGRALQTAILSLAMGRQLTRDRVPLSQIVLAALVIDSGHARIQGRVGDRFLSEKEEAAAVPATAFTCIATGGVNPANMRRTATVVEAAWGGRSELMGAPWNGQLAPALVSQILMTAHMFLELVAPRDGKDARTPPAAFEALLASPHVDRTVSRLLVRAIGLIPPGTVVELSDGSWAVTAGPSKRGPHACTVRLIVDGKGNEVHPPRSIDLGDVTSLRIEHIVDSARVKFKTSGAFITSS